MKLMQRIRRLLNRTVEYNNDPQRDRVWLPTRNSGVAVTHDTALTFSAVFRAISYISTQIAVMPWRVMSESNGRKEVVTSHGVDRLLHIRPNPEMTAFTDDEGQCVLASVPVGAVRLRLSRPGSVTRTVDTIEVPPEGLDIGDQDRGPDDVDLKITGFDPREQALVNRVDTLDALPAGRSDHGDQTD